MQQPNYFPIRVDLLPLQQHKKPFRFALFSHDSNEILIIETLSIYFLRLAIQIINTSSIVDHVYDGDVILMID